VRNDRLGWSWRLASGGPLAAARALKLPEGYRTEIQQAAQGFVRSLARVLEKGAAFFVDYGFPQKEYYHPQRKDGTLMCHYRHTRTPILFPPRPAGHHQPRGFQRHCRRRARGRAGSRRLRQPGAVPRQLRHHRGDVAHAAEDGAKFLPLANQANRLMSPAEMGELFKVIAFARGFSRPLLGFAEGDRRSAL